MRKLGLLGMIGIGLMIGFLSTSCEKEQKEDISLQEMEPNGSFSTALELKQNQLYEASLSAADKDYYLIHSTSDLEIHVEGDEHLSLHIVACDDSQQHIWEHSRLNCNENHGHSDHSCNCDGDDHGEHQEHDCDTAPHSESLLHAIKAHEYQGTCYIVVESANSSDSGKYTIKIN